jgi:hypothetical protein
MGPEQLECFVRGLGRIVDPEGVEGRVEGSFLAGIVEMITCEPIATCVAAICQPSLTYDFIGVEEDFDLGEGEDFGADVAAFHDERAEIGASALAGDHPITDFADLGDGWDCGFDGVGADFEGWEVAIYMEPGFAVDDADLGFPTAQEADDGGFVGGLQGEGGAETVLEGPPGEGAVHGTGIDVDVAEIGGEAAGKGALA